jgi:hypothetical protein
MLNVKSIVLILVIVIVLAVLFFFFVLTRVPTDLIQILMSNGLAMHERNIFLAVFTTDVGT